MKAMDRPTRIVNHLLFVLVLAFPCPVLCATDWFAQGIGHMRTHHYQKAIVAFSRAIAENPDRAENYNNRGIAWSRNGDYDLALADFNRAMELDPRNAEIFNNRGTIWFYKGQFDRAISDYDKALGIDPNSAKAYSNRGAAWFCKGNFDRTVSDYHKALAIDPDNVEINRQLAWILSNTSAPDREHGTQARDRRTDSKGMKGGPSVSKPVQTRTRPPSKPDAPQQKSDVPIHRPATQPPGPTEHTPGSASTVVYTVQVGAFASRQNAGQLVARMKKKGYEARMATFLTWRKTVLYTVRIGNYARLAVAKKMAAELTAKENIPTTVRPTNEL